MMIFKASEIQEHPHKKNKNELLGFILCAIRGLFKALDVVYIEWFLHFLKGLSFSEKNLSVSFWFLITSFVSVMIESRMFTLPVFVGISGLVWCYCLVGTLFGVSIYVLIQQTDSLVF